jgi:bifunctional DNA-binding transcriptional regulator/antitoxin component of YhaV-PrlF toxin-antitoxin module
MNELKLQETQDGDLFFAIPDDVLDRLDWTEGDDIKCIEKDNGFILKKVKYENVELEFDDEELLKYMLFAHEKDMTFNELCQNAVREKLNEIDSQ